jgi:hypothetical protein
MIFVGISGPGEGLGLLVVLSKEAIDGGLEVDERIDLLPFLPSFMSRVCSGYAPSQGELQTRLG